MDSLDAFVVSDRLLERAISVPWNDIVDGGGWHHPFEVLGAVNSTPTGVFRIKGVLTRDGSPIAAVFHVHRRRDGLLLKAGMSDVSGQYEVTGLPDENVYLVAIDPRNEYNAGILDRLQPEA